MRKCPFCDEDIQDEAIKCKHCKEWLELKGLSNTDNSNSAKPAKNNVIEQKKQLSKRYHNGLGGLVFLPTEEGPLSLGKIKVYTSHFIHEGTEFLFKDIKNIKHNAINNKVFAGGVTTTIREDEYAEITTKHNVKIKAKASKGMFFGLEKIASFSNAIKYLLFETYQQRYEFYIEDLKSTGYLYYDKTKFFPDGKIITRNNTEINLGEYELKFYPGLIKLEKKYVNSLTIIGRKIINRHPNTNFWRGVIHGEMTIDTTVDTDVFSSLLNYLYN